MFNKIPSYY